MKKLVGIIGIIAGGLLILCLFSIGWYYISFETSLEGESVETGMKLGLSKTTMYADIDGDYESEDFEYEDDDKIGDFFGLVKLILMVGIGLTFIFVILAFLAGGKIPGWVPLIIGIIATLLVAAGPSYMAYSLPETMTADYEEQFDEVEGPGPWDTFMGSDNETIEGEDVEFSWGPSWCWYVSVGASLLLLIASLLCIGIKREGNEWDNEYEDEEDSDDDYDVEDEYESDYDTPDDDYFKSIVSGSGETQGIGRQKSCIQCGAMLATPDTKFCSSCGANQTSVSSAIPQQKSCNQCGAMLATPDTKFCSSCGANQTSVTSPIPQQKSCNQCGAMLAPPDAKFCISCGTIQTAGNAVFQQQQKGCVQCGVILDPPDTKFCPSCGANQSMISGMDPPSTKPPS